MIKVSSRAVVIASFNYKRIRFQAHSSSCQQDSIPHGLWPGPSLSFLPDGLLHRAAHNTAAGFHQSKRRQMRWKPESFYTLVVEVISHHFYHILCIGSRSLVPYSRGGRYTGHDQQESEIIWSYFRSYLSHSFSPLEFAFSLLL